MTNSQFVLTVILLAALLGGCNKENPSEPIQNSVVFRLTPGDGQTDVTRSSSIVLTFRKRVDRSPVERGLRLISASALIDSLCPVGGYRHGTMEAAMHNTTIMSHLDSLHSTVGHFAWSDDSLSVTFTPHSILNHHTSYMIHVMPEMKAMMEQRLGDLGTIGQGGMRMSDMRFHFTTGMQ